MAQAKLHLICGNCGCSDMWKWEFIEDDGSLENKPNPTVYLWCDNCSTLHDLNDNAEIK